MKYVHIPFFNLFFTSRHIFYVCYLYLLVKMYYSYIWKRREILDQSTFDTFSTHDFSNQNKLQQKCHQLWFFYEKSGLHIIISFYVPTYIHMYIVSRCTIYIRKHRKRLWKDSLTYVNQIEPQHMCAAADWWHSGVTYFLATLSHEIWILLEFKASNFRNFPGIYSIL